MHHRYPFALAGVRFHEVYGSDINWRIDAGKDGFPLDPAVFTVFADACGAAGMVMLINDHTWFFRSDPGES
jgi:hypothetical protein